MDAEPLLLAAVEHAKPRFPLDEQLRSDVLPVRHAQGQAVGQHLLGRLLPGLEHCLLRERALLLRHRGE